MPPGNACSAAATGAAAVRPERRPRRSRFSSSEAELVSSRLSEMYTMAMGTYICS